MQIHLNQSEIQKALLEHIANTGVPLTNATTSVVFIAGRKTNGHSAVITIDYGTPEIDSTDIPSENEEEIAERQQAISFAFGKSKDI